MEAIPFRCFAEVRVTCSYIMFVGMEDSQNRRDGRIQKEG